jgi:hypothetical protein
LKTQQRIVVDGVTVVHVGPFAPGDRGSLVATYAITARPPENCPFGERPYSTHLLVWDDMNRWLLRDGHYDLTFEAAEQDLERR